MCAAGYASSVKRARQLGSLTGFASGTTSASDPTAVGTLRLFENIIAAMLPEEKSNLESFNSPARQRVASTVGCTTAQVDDCIARYQWTKSMTSKMAQLKKEGKPVQTCIDDVERLLGTWRQYKTESKNSGGGSGGGGVAGAPTGPKGKACPLAGFESIGKNTKCPLTKKAYKSCCGKQRR